MARYIDAEQMESDGENHFPYNISYCDEGDIDQWIRDQPTANVAPVVHAGWIDLDHGFQMCSGCGEQCIEDRDDLPFKAYGFCPYCGAKMDQEVIVLAPEVQKK